MASFTHVIDLLLAPPDSLTEEQLSERAVLELVKAVNKERKTAGVPLLHMDEHCNKAASEIANRIGQVHSAVTSCGVVGSEFTMVNSEKSHQMPSPPSNEAVLNAFISQLRMMDMSSQRILADSQFTHCGFAVKKVYDNLKIHGILFKKVLCAFHVSFDVNEGIKIRGKMLDRGCSLCCVVVKDAASASSKPSLAGPSRMKFNADTLEYEVNIPRMILSSRALAAKELEFFVTTDSPRVLNYGAMPDVNEIKQGALIGHRMVFNSLWESNVMIEERSLSDSEFIKNEHESKNSTGLMEFDKGGGGKRGGVRGRGTAVRGRGTLASSRGWGAPGSTPFKNGHLGLHGRPAGSNIPTTSDWPQNENAPPLGDVDMKVEPSQVSFIPPTSHHNMQNSPFAPPNAFTAPQTQAPFQQPFPQPSFQPPAPQQPPFQPPQFQQPPFQPPPFQQSFQTPQFPQTFQPPPFQQPPFQQSFAQPVYQQPFPPQPMYQQPPTPFVQYPSSMQFPFPYYPDQAAAMFGRPAPESVFGPASTHSTLGNTLPPKKTQKAAQTSTEECEALQETEGVMIPGLLMPIPTRLFEQARYSSLENESSRGLWTSMDYYDVLLKLKDCELKAHRGVISASSPFFKEHLDKAKSFSSAPVAKLVLPSWVAERPLRLALMFMYGCDIDKEHLDLTLVRELLVLADFLGVGELVVSLAIKHVVLKLTKEEVLGFMKLCFQRGTKQAREAWVFLGEYCARFAADHANWLLRNRKSELQTAPLPLLFKTVESALRLHASSELISLLITVLVEAGFSEDIFQLCNKISGLCLLGYHDSPVDIRMVDLLKPYEDEHFEKLPPDQVMEFGTFKETDPHYLTTVRANPVPPPALGEGFNSCTVPVDSSSDLKSSLGYKQTYQTLPVVAVEELRPKKATFSFALSELQRPRTVVSPVFATEARSWFLTVVLEEEHCSVFLCERGKGKAEAEELLYTSVVCELTLETLGFAQTCVFFHCFPNSHFHCAGQRHVCKLSRFGDASRLTVRASLREFPIHSATLHYLGERFETFNDKKYRHFKPLSFYDFRSLLLHDCLKVKDERAVVAALWRYAATKETAMINQVVPAVRLQYLSIEDLCGLARDHEVLRACSNFQWAFQQEFYRRIKAAPVTEKPRVGYADKPLPCVNHIEALIQWLLTADHHEGYSRKLEEEKKRYEEEKAEFEKRRAELTARKHELFIENERLHSEVKQIRKELPSEGLEYSEPRSPQQECRVM